MSPVVKKVKEAERVSFGVTSRPNQSEHNVKTSRNITSKPVGASRQNQSKHRAKEEHIFVVSGRFILKKLHHSPFKGGTSSSSNQQVILGY
jgi:hypothetical protein